VRKKLGAFGVRFPPRVVCGINHKCLYNIITWPWRINLPNLPVTDCKVGVFHSCDFRWGGWDPPLKFTA